MKLPWFNFRVIIFYPVSAAGWIVTLSAVGYGIYTYIDIDSRSLSLIDTLINFASRMGIVFLIFCVIVYLTTPSNNFMKYGRQLRESLLIMQKTAGANIKELRIKKGISLEELAAKCNFSLPVMNSIEEGTWKDLDEHALERVCNVLGTDIETILANCEFPFDPNDIMNPK